MERDAVVARLENRVWEVIDRVFVIENNLLFSSPNQISSRVNISIAIIDRRLDRILPLAKLLALDHKFEVSCICDLRMQAHVDLASDDLSRRVERSVGLKLQVPLFE